MTPLSIRPRWFIWHCHHHSFIHHERLVYFGPASNHVSSFSTRAPFIHESCEKNGNENATSLFASTVHNATSLFSASLSPMEELTTPDSGSDYVSLAEAKAKFKRWRGAVLKKENLED